MSLAFVRSLGAESGVQLNPLRDESEIPNLSLSDQTFGIMMRATRGRIDKPFKVHRGNVFTKLGHGEQMRLNALNEAWVQVVEALNNGAYEAVVQRLVGTDAAISYAVATLENRGSGAVLTPVMAGSGADQTVASVTVTNGGAGYVSPVTLTFSGGTPATAATATATVTNGVITGVTVTSAGSGYDSAPTLAAAGAPTITYAVSATDPADDENTPYLLGVKHLDCHNDGIILELHADEKKVSGAEVSNDVVTLRIRDSNSVLLHEFTGSLDSTAVDDYGNSYYLPDVISNLTDALVVTVGAGTIAASNAAYGYTNGQENWVASDVLECFDEGALAFETSDYQAARKKLQYTEHDYMYLSAGGSENTALLSELAQLAFDTNRQLRFDVPGDLTPDNAIAWLEQLDFGASPTAHLLHAFWAPLKSADPTGINPKGYFGTATLNIAYACGRNAQTDAKGFAPKNYPIAGREWPIRRTRLEQTWNPSDQELNALAKAKINPVLFDQFTGGGRYVFRDSLTCALVESSLKKLIAVADMSASVDEVVTRYGKDVLQLPMQTAIKRMQDFLTSFFEGAQAAGWLVPSSSPAMNGAAWRFEVKANEARPYDRMDVSYWLRYDGTVRQIFVTQTLTR